MAKLISHELPLSLMQTQHDEFNDYMYLLLHKCMEDKDYLAAAIAYKGVKYLDNSCFELGASLDKKDLEYYFNATQADIVIAPDVLGKRQDTLERTFDFIFTTRIPLKHIMVVAQGATIQEIIDCYNVFKQIKHIGMIGIPFVYSWIPKDPTLQAQGRIDLLDKMVKEEVIDTTKKHHLLGTWQAKEFAWYRNYNWIHSLDTSNPVMAACDGIAYTDLGIDVKPRSTFDSVYHKTKLDINMQLLYNNVKKFKEIVHGK